MKTFFKKFSRLFFFILALSSGLLITYGISVISEKSKGPLITILDNAENVINKVEHKIVIDRRSSQRKNELQWVSQMQNDKKKLINPSYLLLGASDTSHRSFESIISLENSLNINFPIIQIYSAWGSKPEHEFPTEEVNAIHGLGSIPLITWEPWISDFNDAEYKLPEKLQNEKSLLPIISGVYDLYIKNWALKAKKYAHPIYIRLGHEMNDPNRYPWGIKNNPPQYYTKAWQHIYNIFKYLQVDNVIWVWSPHLSYNYLDDYYPGDQYVDIVATGVLNFGDIATWSSWYSFEELFGQHYAIIAKYNKPIMIAEFGSLGSGKKRAEWFSKALHNLPEKYPQVKFVIFFHYDQDYSVSDNRIANWYIKDDSETVSAIKKELQSIMNYKE